MGALLNDNTRKYTSNNCTIKSVFDHPKTKVDQVKHQILRNMREELNDTVSEKLHELDISAKVVTYTEY